MKNAFGTSLVVSTCLLGACALSNADSANDRAHAPVDRNTPSSASALALEPMRLIVQFKEPLAYQDHALLKRIQTQTHARAQYIAAVSKDTHVYSFQPAVGQSYAQLLQKLRAIPEVASVEMDQKTMAN